MNCRRVSRSGGDVESRAVAACVTSPEGRGRIASPDAIRVRVQVPRSSCGPSPGLRCAQSDLSPPGRGDRVLAKKPQAARARAPSLAKGVRGEARSFSQNKFAKMK